MARAEEHDLAPGKAILICSAEDLIVHKAVAGRAQDIRDSDLFETPWRKLEE